MTDEEDFRLRLVESMGRSEAALMNLTESVHELKAEVKEIPQHSDIVIRELRMHFDERITSCRDDMQTILMDKHLNKDQTRDNITRAIQANNSRIWSKVKAVALGSALTGSVLAFLAKYGTVILTIMESDIDG